MLTARDIARVCHEANRYYSICVYDYTHKPWEDTSVAIQESAVRGVEAVLANPEITPEQLHEDWVEGKKKAGWKYGQRKNESTKEHPCLLPYEELPEEQRRKDELFRAVVNALRP